VATKSIYKIVFHNQGEIFEIFAGEVTQASMFGFIEVGDLLFGQRSSIITDPTEEKLRLEFADVEHTYIPIQAVVRIDHVKRTGTSRIRPVAKGDKVSRLPGLQLPPETSES
jgi:hypothetical protein